MVKLDLKTIYEWPFTLQLLVVLPLCALILYLAYFFDFTLLNRALMDGKRQENDLKEQISLIFTQQIKLENDLTKFKVLELMISEWQAKLVPPAKLPNLLNDILKIGTANNLKFDQMQPGVEVKDEIYMKVPIKIKVRGGYHQVANFISQVANLPLLVVVKGIIIEKSNPQNAIGKNLTEQAALKSLLTVELMLEVYSLSETLPNEKK